VEIKKDKINLKELAGEVWENLRYAPEANTIDLQLDFPEQTIVESDRGRVKVMLSNLISNAIRYHDLSKSKRFIRLAARANGHAFCLEVEDNGQGIDPQYQMKIFEMFFRAHEKSKGSGLGLYIVRETAAKLQGTVDVESKPGLGSVFTIRLPYPVLKQA
jgi:signal transduction histidine kinase